MARTIEVLPMAESLSILLHDAASAEWVENWDEMQGMPTAVKLELVTTMAEEQTEEEVDEEEEEEAAEVPESKMLTLLVHIPASRYAPSEDQGGGGQDEGFEEGEEEPQDEQGPQEGPGGGGGGGGGGQGGPEIPELPGFPTGGFPSQGGGGGGGGR
jgi:phage repressor protein C with HTH and peptisase S24 domain